MTKERLISLDVFRGFTIIMMTIVNNPGSWDHIYRPLEHAEWNGCTPTDLVFPFFIFIMGVAIPFAMPDKSFDSGAFNKIGVRALRIFCLGLFLNFFGKIELLGLEGIPLLMFRLFITVVVSYALLGNFSLKVKTYSTLAVFVTLFFLAYSGITAFSEVRIPGVLQRIGIVYFFVSLLYLKSSYRTQIIAALSLLLLYWVLMAIVPVPGIGEANFDKATNLAAWIDSVVLKGHMWVFSKTWDPEGILSTVPAIASGIIGLLTGQLLIGNFQKLVIVKRMAISGFVLVALGLLWSVIFPINKSLWTSSYVLYTSGLAILSLALLYYLIEVADYKKWTEPFLIWGVNPMIVFFFSGIIPQSLRMIQFQNPVAPSEQINLQKYLYTSFIEPFFYNPHTASVIGASIYVVIWSIILWIFYRNKLIFKV